ncbi:MAG: DUF1007 family protein [Candidatus Cloacimonetes bacterium]|nr:DUF1007 family protein [Candidatus Cloacimonadota bacterium]MDD4156674.1 DUF1007 family protein [Candidatus Cloacimonadota bacterium]
MSFKLKRVDYFTQIEFNNKKFIIHEVLNFNAYTLQKSSNEIYVTYEFSLPINLKISDDILNFKIKKYDETIFTAFENATLEITSNDYELSDIKNITYKFCGKQLSGKLKKK